MKRLYLYSPSAQGGKVLDRQLYLNTTPVYLTAYVKRQDPELMKHFTWAKIQLMEKDRTQLIAELESYQIDILCVSIYVWNCHEIMDLIRGIKQELTRPLTIIAGGPSVDPHRNHEYLKQNPDVDFAVYAQGEQAFCDIMNHLIHGHSLNILQTKNAAWMDGDRMKTSQFAFFKLKDGSPYVEAKEVLQQIVEDPEYKDHVFFMPYETSKGCAYNCSFCDWTSGLTHKVSHRRFAWEDELDLLGGMGLVNFHLSDSNFGQHRQDIEIARTMARLKQEKGYQFYITDTNFSKLRKKESFEILKVLLDAGIVKNPKFAVQDIHEKVLDNIDRPDVPWSEHRAYIEEIRNLYPDFECRIELIMGLPGQTRDSWEETLLQMQGLTPAIYTWIILPNSPAGYDPAYRDRMQITTAKIPLSDASRVHNDVVISTYSYDFDDYAYFLLLRRLVLHEFVGSMKDRRKVFDLIRRSPQLVGLLDLIKTNFLINNGKAISPDIEKFIESLILGQFRSQWSSEEITSYLLYRRLNLSL